MVSATSTTSQDKFAFESLAQLLRYKNTESAETGFSATSEVWNQIVDLTETHRVLPLIHKTLENEKINVPPKIRNEIADKYKENTKLNFARSTQLIKLVQAIQEKGLAVAAYKGPALACSSYNDLSLRQFTDLDIIVRKEEFDDVESALISTGCVKAHEMSEKERRATLKHSYDIPYFFGDTNTLVEVHWSFIEHFFAFDYEDSGFWGRIETFDLLGKRMPTLAVEDSLIVVCAHGSKHFWKRLSWICDVGHIIENADINWVQFERLAHKSGSLRMVRLGVWLAVHLLGTKIPDGAEVLVADQKTFELGKMILNRLEKGLDQPSDWLEMAAAHVAMRERFVSKTSYCLRLLTTKMRDKLFLPMGRPT